MSGLQRSEAKCGDTIARWWIVAVAAIVFQLPMWTPRSASGEMHGGFVFNKRFTTTFTWRREPTWKQDTPNPPVSARKALELATQVVERVTREHGGEWNDTWERRLADICLSSTERYTTTKDEWYWTVRYVWHPRKGNHNGALPFLVIPVAMDGTASEAKNDGEYEGVLPVLLDLATGRPLTLATLTASTIQTKYERVELREEDLPEMPSWDDVAENPPLSARRALVLSKTTVEKVERKDELLRKEWKKSPELALAKLGERWYWHVKYTWMPRFGTLGGVPPTFNIAVLMNGDVITPTAVNPKR